MTQRRGDAGQALRAIIYVLMGQSHSTRWIERCRAWVETCGYQLVAVIEDDGGRAGLRDGIQMLIGGRAEVMVVASSDYLPSDWIPRIEVAGDWAGDHPFAVRAETPNQRRPRPPRSAEK